MATTLLAIYGIACAAVVFFLMALAFASAFGKYRWNVKVAAQDSRVDVNRHQFCAPYHSRRPERSFHHGNRTHICTDHTETSTR